jgi:DNA-binding LytR/AlgR family response regulator
MNILIVEDEELAASRLKQMIERIEKDPCRFSFASSVSESVQILQNNAFDLLFLDIRLGDGLSFNIFEHVTVEPPIIFTTAYDAYAIKAFKLNSIDYLLKPIEHEELKNALDKFRKNTSLHNKSTIDIDFQLLSNMILGLKASTHFFSRRGDKTLIIKLGDIAYFYAKDGYTHCTTFQNQTYILEDTLDHIASKVEPKSFFRINRSMLLHRDTIRSFESYFNQRISLQVEPQYQEEVIVVREQVKAFKTWLRNEQSTF